MRLESLRAPLLCALGGVLYFLSFLSFDLFPLTWICFVPVLWAIRESSPKRALLLGWWFGFVTNAGGFYWVIHLLTEFGRAHITLAVLGFALLCAYQGFLLAAAIGLVRIAQLRLHVAPVWSLPVAMVALEWVYPLLFPSYIGNSQFRFTTLTQVVDVTGVLGLTAMIGLLNGAAYEALSHALARQRPSLLRLGIPLVCFAAAIAYGAVRLPQIDAQTAQAETIRVGLVQTNLGARFKEEAPATFMAAHVTMTEQLLAQAPALDLVIWPESAYDGVLPKEAADRRYRVFAQLGAPVMLGAITIDDANRDGRAEYFNSLVLMSREGAMVDVFDKVELIAFAETLPLARLVPQIGQVIGNGNWFTHGTSFTHLRLGELRFLPTVCYEDIFPAMVRRLWREDGPADVLVNVTNDSWYGDTHEPMIHLVLATFRSIETRRALIRATNTGISAIVDPAGRIAQRTGQWTRETLVADVPLIRDGSTTIYMRIGDVIAYVSILLIFLGLIALWRARKTHR